jgi:hypothetical protein
VVFTTTGSPAFADFESSFPTSSVFTGRISIPAPPDPLPDPLAAPTPRAELLALLEPDPLTCAPCLFTCALPLVELDPLTCVPFPSALVLCCAVALACCAMRETLAKEIKATVSKLAVFMLISSKISLARPTPCHAQVGLQTVLMPDTLHLVCQAPASRANSFKILIQNSMEFTRAPEFPARSPLSQAPTGKSLLTLCRFFLSSRTESR